MHCIIGGICVAVTPGSEIASEMQESGFADRAQDQPSHVMQWVGSTNYVGCIVMWSECYEMQCNPNLWWRRGEVMWFGCIVMWSAGEHTVTVMQICGGGG